MPVSEKDKFVTKKKDKTRKTSSSSSDLRQRIKQKKERNVQNPEVIN